MGRDPVITLLGLEWDLKYLAMLPQESQKACDGKQVNWASEDGYGKILAACSDSLGTYHSTRN